jgi:hypothetical protein
MKKIAVSLALSAIAFAAQAQNMDAPGSAVSSFVDQPYNCVQMLGGGNDGDTLPSSYNVALDASLKEIKAPVDQAFALLNARCAQRVSERQSQGVARVSELNLTR